jgi:hypothetical protein
MAAMTGTGLFHGVTGAASDACRDKSAPTADRYAG